MKFLSFLAENTGKLSFMRLSAFLLILFYIFVGIFISIKTNQIPDIPIQMAGLIVLLYGINKFSNNFKK